MPSRPSQPVLDMHTLKRAMGAEDAGELDGVISALFPEAKRRKPRRWLSASQKPHVCGLGGCSKSYGSASSLCAHKRAHHPGWRTYRSSREDKPKAPPPSASMPGAVAAAAHAHGGAAGTWISVLSADAGGRLGALKRSRVRAQRACRDETYQAASLAPATSSQQHAACAAAEIAARAASARLCRAVDLAIDEEIGRLEIWVAQLDDIAAEAARLGSQRFMAQLATTKPGSSGAMGAAASAMASIQAASLAAAAIETAPAPPVRGSGSARRGVVSPGESKESVPLEASPEVLTASGGSPSLNCSGGGAQTQTVLEAGLASEEEEDDVASPQGKGIWHKGFVQELQKAELVEDALALGPGGAALAQMWPQ